MVNLVARSTASMIIFPVWPVTTPACSGERLEAAVRLLSQFEGPRLGASTFGATSAVWLEEGRFGRDC